MLRSMLIQVLVTHFLKFKFGLHIVATKFHKLCVVYTTNVLCKLLCRFSRTSVGEDARGSNMVRKWGCFSLDSWRLNGEHFKLLNWWLSLRKCLECGGCRLTFKQMVVERKY